jgi:hypothetical protein
MSTDLQSIILKALGFEPVLLIAIGQYRARQAHEISIPMQITGFDGRTFERVEYSKHSIL